MEDMGRRLNADMKTRTLILWSLVCGVIILVAGSVKLFQVSSNDSAVEFLALGESATVADMVVAVKGFERSEQFTLVTVTMNGPDGADAREGWRVVVGDRVLAPVDGPVDASDECALVSATPVTCTVFFPALDESLVVAYLRAGDQQQWTAES
jgi:hypothetical protein